MRTNPPHKRRKKASLEERQAEMLLASAECFAEKCKEALLIFLRPNCEMLMKLPTMNGDSQTGVMPAINPDGSRATAPEGWSFVPAFSRPMGEGELRAVSKALGIPFQEAQRSMYAADKLRQGARP